MADGRDLFWGGACRDVLITEPVMKRDGDVYRDNETHILFFVIVLRPKTRQFDVNLRIKHHYQNSQTIVHTADMAAGKSGEFALPETRQALHVQRINQTS